MVSFRPQKPILLLLISLAELSAGITLLAFGDTLKDVFHYIVGAVSFALGAVSCGSAWFLRGKQNYRVALGVVLFALGAITVFSPHSPVFVCVLWGVLSIVKAAIGIDRCFKLKLTDPLCLLKFVFDCAELVLGVVLLLELTDALGHHIFFLGVVLTVYGVEYLIRFFYALKRKKQEEPPAENEREAA